MTIKPIFAWYDIWVGVFIDRPKRRVYIFPIPCFGLVIQRRQPRPSFIASNGRPSTGLVE